MNMFPNEYDWIAITTMSPVWNIFLNIYTLFKTIRTIEFYFVNWWESRPIPGFCSNANFTSSLSTRRDPIKIQRR